MLVDTARTQYSHLTLCVFLTFPVQSFYVMFKEPLSLDMVAKSMRVLAGFPCKGVMGSNAARVKSITYQIYTYRYPAWHLALIG